jgi:hypothetical protein
MVLNASSARRAAQAVLYRRAFAKICGSQIEGGADAVLDERAGQVAGDRMGGLPAGAVGRDDHIGCELFQRADSVGDDRLEQRPGQVEPADDGYGAPVPVSRWA